MMVVDVLILKLVVLILNRLQTGLMQIEMLLQMTIQCCTRKQRLLSPVSIFRLSLSDETLSLLDFTGNVIAEVSLLEAAVLLARGYIVLEFAATVLIVVLDGMAFGAFGCN